MQTPEVYKVLKGLVWENVCFSDHYKDKYVISITRCPAHVDLTLLLLQFIACCVTIRSINMVINQEKTFTAIIHENVIEKY